MKFIILLIFSIVHVHAQIKLNTRNEVDILLEDKDLSLNKIFNGKEPYLFKLINNTNNTYVIDPYGFKSDNYVIACDGNIVPPDKIILSGFYKRVDDEDCYNDLIILKPKEEKYVSLNIVTLNAWYDLNKDKKYILNLSSKHNNYTITLLGCQDYIKTLVEKKGYRVLEDNINIKVPLVP